MKKIIIHLVLFLSLFSFSQENSIKFLDISNGLSNNSILTIYQDSDGFMWFGTYDGLNRYDGYNFKIYRNRINDKNYLSFNTIYSIEEDYRKNIWVAGSNGACVFDRKSFIFQPIQHATSSNKTEIVKETIHQISSVSKELVLVASQNFGLLVYKDGLFTGKTIALKETNKVKKYNYDATVIENDLKNNCSWVYIANVGICRYSYKSKQFNLIYRLSKDVKCMNLSPNGNLWLGTDEGLYVFNANYNSLSDNYLTTNCTVTDILQDNKKEIWVSTDGCGIYKVLDNNDKAIPYHLANGKQFVKSNSISSLHEDTDGNKWIGTLRGGISMIGNKPKYFKHIKNEKNSNPAENFILSFCEDDQKNLWIGTDGAGLKFWNKKSDTYKVYSASTNAKYKISSNFITSIITGSKDEIWLSTWAGGVNRINTSNNSISQFSCYNPFTKRIEKNIWFVYRDSKGNIWASATNEGFLYVFDKIRNAFVLFDKSIDNLQCLTETSDGKLWGGNYTSLFAIDKRLNRYKKITIGSTIRCIYEDKDKNLWLGTQDGGLLLFDRKTNKFKRLTTDDGLPSNTILRILEDKAGNLWMSTYNGICRFDKIRKSFRNFSVNDGLQSNQFSFNAGIKLSSGEFLFGGINGFNSFYPEQIKEFNQRNKLLLTDFQVNNQPIEENKNGLISEWDFGKIKEVVLPYNQTTLSIGFVALDFNNADKINYAYKLEGWDDQWSYVTQIRKANYTRLASGKYIFKVKTTNLKGGWNTEKNLVTVVVLPPWYMTWWAYSIYLLAGAGIIYGYIKYNKNKEKLKYKVKIAELEIIKEKVTTQVLKNFIKDKKIITTFET